MCEELTDFFAVEHEADALLSALREIESRHGAGLSIFKYGLIIHFGTGNPIDFKVRGRVKYAREVLAIGKRYKSVMAALHASRCSFVQHRAIVDIGRLFTAA